LLIYEPIDWNIYAGGHILHKVESVLVTQMNFQWREGVYGREGVYDQCALYEELIRDDGKVLGCVMRFFEENCPTYAMTETKRLGPKKGDQAARRAVENAISEEERQTDVAPHAEAVCDLINLPARSMGETELINGKQNSKPDITRRRGHGIRVDPGPSN
jgi:hypothetical protein